MWHLIRDSFIPCEHNEFRPRILETQYFLILTGLVVGVKILTLVSFWGYFGATIFNQVSQGDLYALSNQVRSANGVELLNVNTKLEAAAQLKLADMFSNNYFAHISPTGVQPWAWFDKSNYSYKVAGENLAMNFLSSEEVVNAWMNSESHRKNLLLRDFKEIGIAVGSGIINGEKTIAVVQVFGTPLKSKTGVAIVNNKPKIIITPKPQPIVIKASTPVPVVKPQATPQAAGVIGTPSPKPVDSVTKPKSRALPISLKGVIPIVPQVKSASIEDNLEWDDISLLANSGLKSILLAISVFMVLTLFLKVFIAIRIQFPVLIAKAALLIIISILAFSISDDEFFVSKLRISEKAEVWATSNR